MAETTNVSKLIINYLTEDQYRTAKASSLINENELYVTDVQDSTTLDCFEELFTATGGQTLFTLTEGTYQIGESRLTICVNGAQQPSTAYTETSSSSFTFDSGLSAGDSVIARYVNARIVSDINLEPHKTSHYSGGTDPLTPSDIGAATSTHKSSHATGGTDVLSPEDIGAAKWFSAETTGTGADLLASVSDFTLTDGATIRIKLHTDMSAGATLNVSNLGGKPIVDIQGKGAKAAAGSWLTLIYNSVIENFILQGSGGDAQKYGDGVGQISTEEAALVFKYNALSIGWR